MEQHKKKKTLMYVTKNANHKEYYFMGQRWNIQAPSKSNQRWSGLPKAVRLFSDMRVSLLNVIDVSRSARKEAKLLKANKLQCIEKLLPHLQQLEIAWKTLESGSSVRSREIGIILNSL
jgi:hypothetical protein